MKRLPQDEPSLLLIESRLDRLSDYLTSRLRRRAYVSLKEHDTEEGKPAVWYIASCGSGTVWCRYDFVAAQPAEWAQSVISLLKTHLTTHGESHDA